MGAAGPVACPGFLLGGTGSVFWLVELDLLSGVQ